MSETTLKQADNKKTPGSPAIKHLDESLAKIFSSPGLLFLTSIVLIFLAEVIVMIVISILPPLTIIVEAFIDAFLLSFIAVPIFYFLMLRPIQLHIKERNRVENELIQHRMHLEKLVEGRTKELLDVNEKLSMEIEKKNEAEKSLALRMQELESFYDLSIGRELKMKEMKEQLEQLKSELSRYKK
jgi:hypothetical protein